MEIAREREKERDRDTDEYLYLFLYLCLYLNLYIELKIETEIEIERETEIAIEIVPQIFHTINLQVQAATPYLNINEMGRKVAYNFGEPFVGTPIVIKELPTR